MVSFAVAPATCGFVKPALRSRAPARRPLVQQRVRSEAGQSAPAAAGPSADKLFSDLDIDLDNYRRAPASVVSLNSLVLVCCGHGCCPSLT